jgi:hypothetical protein
MERKNLKATATASTRQLLKLFLKNKAEKQNEITLCLGRMSAILPLIFSMSLNFKIVLKVV